MKKATIIFIVSILILGAITGGYYANKIDFRHLTTDSGFDSDWDSDWDYDWDSGSSWDDDYDYDYDYGSSYDYDTDTDYGSGSSRGYSGGGGGVGSVSIEILAPLTVMAFMAFLPVAIIFSKLNSHKKPASSSEVTAGVDFIHKNDFVDLPLYSSLSTRDLELLSKYGLDKDSILDYAYNSYVRIQKAWASNNIEEAKDSLSNELYNTYKSQIATLVKKGERNEMSDFIYRDGCINSVLETEDDTLTVVLNLRVSCKDYMVKEATGEVIRGNDKKHNDYLYELKYVIHNNTDKSIKTCPNCNAEITGDGETIKCEYCGCDIVRKSHKLVLTGKKMISQR
jgi:hypothetical protein